MPEKHDSDRHQHPGTAAGVANPTDNSFVPVPLRRGTYAIGASYAELCCKSNFSFLRGASHPEELAERAAELGYAAITLTDRNTLAGVVRMHCAAKACNIKLIVGAEITPVDAPAIVLYATDRASYSRLARLITAGRLRSPKGSCAVTLDDIAAGTQGLIAAVPDNACRLDRSVDECASALHGYRDIFGDRLHLAVSVHGGPDDDRHLARMDALARATGAAMIATNDVHYHESRRRFLQDVLTCIRERCTLAEAGRRIFANAERHLKSIEEMQRLFVDYPRTLERTVMIADRCIFILDELRYEYPEGICPKGRSPAEFLAELAWSGAKQRYPNGLPEKVRGLIEHELTLIRQLDYEPYFLTVWDIVKFARSRNILCQGRGSAANSAVCYCLGITSVDPEQIDMLFERFVSAERNEPPDIDVDFEHERREEVFQYIYNKYGREHAGIVAEVITYRPRSAIRDVGKALGLSLDRVGTLAKKHEWWDKETLPDDFLRQVGFDPSDRTIRMLGRLIKQLVGFPRHLSQHVGGFVITKGPLCEMVPIGNAAMPDRTFIEWDKDDIDALGILKIDCLALGMLTAIHKCFDYIENELRIMNYELRNTNSECRIANSELQNEKLRVTSYELRDEGTNRERGGDSASFAIRYSPFAIPLALHTVPREDPAVYDMICRADTVGVFQIESRAQMSMLPRLKPRRYYDLVIEVAIVRPGPIQGGMVHPYLRRRSGKEAVTYPNEAIKEVLKRTLGVPLFQEQAMRLAVVAAGFTPGEADRLRRAMGAWRRHGEIERFRAKLIEGMTARGLSKEFAGRCFEQICGFGEYGFPESHAASFALLVYVSAWLKKYHPGEFCAALINSQPMGFYQPAQLIRDAKQHGVKILPIDANFSGYDCRMERNRQQSAANRQLSAITRPPPATVMHHSTIDNPQSACKRQEARGQNPQSAIRNLQSVVRLGMRLIKGVSRAQVEGIERGQGDRPFTSLSDLAHRSGASRATLARLAAADALRSLGLNRRQALWQVLALSDQPPLLQDFEPMEPAVKLPTLSLKDVVMADYDTTGLSLNAHPLALVRDGLKRLGVQPASVLKSAKQGRRLRIAGLVLVRQRPSTAAGIVFCTLEDETGTTNLIIRPAVYQKYRRAAHDSVALIAEGSVQRQGEVVHLLVARLQEMSQGLAELQSVSRDFH